MTEPTRNAVAFWNRLSTVGLQDDCPVVGRPGIRGQSGFALRWVDGWFELIRDGGVRWELERNEFAAITEFVQILMPVFEWAREENIYYQFKTIWPNQLLRNKFVQ